MNIITKIDNIASIIYDGETINSLPAETILLLAPTITKSVDKPVAHLEEILTYTITITNISLSALEDVEFSDDIPAGATYVANSFEVNGVVVAPVIKKDNVSYIIPSIAALGVATIVFQVEVVGGKK